MNFLSQPTSKNYEGCHETANNEQYAEKPSTEKDHQVYSYLDINKTQMAAAQHKQHYCSPPATPQSRRISVFSSLNPHPPALARPKHHSPPPSSAAPPSDYNTPTVAPPSLTILKRPFSPGQSPQQPRRRSFFPNNNVYLAVPQRGCSPNLSVTASSPDMIDFDRQQQIRQQLEQVIADKESFMMSAAASFVQFDMDGNGRLDFTEVQSLMYKLISNLQLPRLDDATLHKIFERYDLDGLGSLNLIQFQSMYWRLLHVVQEKFFPTRKMKVRRSTFIGDRLLSPHVAITNYFKFLKRLGAGSFGEVFLVVEKTSGFQRVCKVINKDQSKIPMEQIDAEILVLKRLDHPHIIKVFDVYQDYNSIYIIMELCDGGELADRISRTFDYGYILTEQYVADLMTQLLAAINYFHTEKVAHKDLKPENILFQSTAPDSPIKVIDFGLAEIFSRIEDFSAVAAGTYLYMAPEVLDYIVTLKCDIWSAGCILFQLLTGEVPFPGTTIEAVEYKLRNDEPPYHILSSLPISSLAIDLLKQMLNKDYRTRISAQECLAHPWLASARTSGVELPKEICSNLKKYKRQSNLKNVLTNMLAHQLNVSGNQIRRINDIFKSLDTDGNGFLSKTELGQGLNRVGFQPHEITQIIHALDVDASDTVSYTEFLAACYSWRESELNVVWTAFNKMDTDGDGKITVEEFVDCIAGRTKNQQNPTESLRIRIASNMQELKRMVREIDVNHDNVIDWDEFLNYMRV